MDIEVHIDGATLAALWWALHPSKLVLYPDRITERRWRPKVSVAWSALAPHNPTAVPAGARTLVLPRRQPDPRLPGPPATAKIPPEDLGVDPAFLATVIAHYVTHPEHRAKIGTPEEYERLRVALRINRASPLSWMPDLTG